MIYIFICFMVVILIKFCVLHGLINIHIFTQSKQCYSYLKCHYHLTLFLIVKQFSSSYSSSSTHLFFHHIFNWIFHHNNLLAKISLQVQWLHPHNSPYCDGKFLIYCRFVSKRAHVNKLCKHSIVLFVIFSKRINETAIMRHPNICNWCNYWLNFNRIQKTHIINQKNSSIGTEYFTSMLKSVGIYDNIINSLADSVEGRLVLFFTNDDDSKFDITWQRLKSMTKVIVLVLCTEWVAPNNTSVAYALGILFTRKSMMQYVITETK